eukprot:4793746-Pleurochrysis_carterae.AAC.1
MPRRAIDMQSAVQQVGASPLLWRQERHQRVWEARRWPARDFCGTKRVYHRASRCQRDGLCTYAAGGEHNHRHGRCLHLADH